MFISELLLYIICIDEFVFMCVGLLLALVVSLTPSQKVTTLIKHFIIIHNISTALKLLYEMMAKNQPEMPLLLFMQVLLFYFFCYNLHYFI